jgi:hypothetical protein
MFQRIMTVINYPRHFAYLALGAMVVFAVVRLHNESIFLISNGFMHAAAVVCALRGAATWRRRALFAAIAPLLSLAALNLVSLLPSTAAQFVGFWLASMIGAASYWFLVRAFWIHKLAFTSLLSAIVLCSAATLLWTMMFRHSLFFAITPLILTIHTLCWWLAFSFSLYWSERASESTII